MDSCRAVVVARLQAMPGVWQLHLLAEAVARAAQPGQFVMALRREGYDPYLRVAVPLHKIGAETVALLLDERDAAQRPLAARGVGERLDLLGPFGQGFALSSGARELLLIAQGLDIAPLVPLAEQAIAEGRRVAVLAATPEREHLFPTELLPRDVEYHGLVAGEGWLLGCRELCTDMLAWADQVCAAGPPALYRDLYQLVAREPVRLRAGFVHCWQPGQIACGMGLCLACAVETRRGMRRTCTDGPVFDLLDLCP